MRGCGGVPKDWATRRLYLGLRAGGAAIGTCLFLPLLSLALGAIPSVVWLAAEALFFLKQRRKWGTLSALTPCALQAHHQNCGLKSQARAWAAHTEVLNSFHALDHNPFCWLSQWFKGADATTLRAEDVAELLAASAWGASKEEVCKAGFGADLDAQVEQLEQYFVHYCSKNGNSCGPRCSTDLVITCGGSASCLNSIACGGMAGLGPTMAETVPLERVSAALAPASWALPSHLCAAPHPHPIPTSSTSTTTHAEHPAPAAGAAPHIVAPFRFKPGPHPSAAPECVGSVPSFYRHTEEPLPHWYRPLLVYGAFEFMAWMNHNMLTWAGFKAHRQGCLEYYTCNTCAAGSGQQPQHVGLDGALLAPVVLLHGVGCGLLPYFKLLVTLASTGVPVIAVEYKHVGQRWCGHEVPSLLDLRDGVLQIMRHHRACGPGACGAHIIAHSFGSAVASTILQADPSAVASLSLLDPICLHMWIPSLLINFIFRPLSFFHPKSDLGFSGKRRKRSASASDTGPPAFSTPAATTPADLPHALHATSKTAVVLGEAPATAGHPYAAEAAASCEALCGGAASSSSSSSSSSSVFGSTSGSIALRRGKPGEAAACLAASGMPKASYSALQGPLAGCAGGVYSGGTCGACRAEGSCDGGSLFCGEAGAMQGSTALEVHKGTPCGRGAAGARGAMLRSCSVRARACSSQLRAWLAWGWSYVPVPHVGRLIKELMLLGPAREMHCAAALCRLMDWRDASLPAHALAPLALKGKALLALSGKDELLPAPLLASWALQHVAGPPRVHLFPELRHADILLYGPAQDQLVMEIMQMAYGSLQPAQPLK